MLSPTIYLRSHSSLPTGLSIKQEILNMEWNSIEEISNLDLMALLHSHHWHYICIQRPHTCVGMAKTPQRATSRAIQQGLRQICPAFNAVEISPGLVSRFGSIYFAKVTLYSRQIQRGFPGVAV